MCLEEFNSLTSLFFVVEGNVHTFNLVDPNDNLIENEIVAVADGVQTEFSIFKTYSLQSRSFKRLIQQVSLTDLNITPAGYAISSTGKITYAVAPTNGTNIEVVLANFLVPVHFLEDRMQSTYEGFRINSANGITLQETILV